MAAVGQRNTSPELTVRRNLHALGARFRIHCDDLPGKPDIVLPSRRLVIFVNGCFWHRHPGCRFAAMPQTRTEYWQQKFARTVARDARNITTLQAMGWSTAIIWTCEI